MNSFFVVDMEVLSEFCMGSSYFTFTSNLRLLALLS